MMQQQAPTIIKKAEAAVQQEEKAAAGIWTDSGSASCEEEIDDQAPAVAQDETAENEVVEVATDELPVAATVDPDTEAHSDSGVSDSDDMIADPVSSEEMMRRAVLVAIAFGILALLTCFGCVCNVCMLHSKVDEHISIEREDIDCSMRKDLEQMRAEIRREFKSLNDEAKKVGEERANTAFKGTFAVYVDSALKKLYKNDPAFQADLKAKGVTPAQMLEAIDEQILRLEGGEEEVTRKREVVRKRALSKAVSEYNEKRIRSYEKWSNTCAHVSGLCYGIAGCSAYACVGKTEDGSYEVFSKSSQFWCCPCYFWEAGTFVFGFFVMAILMILWAVEFFCETCFNDKFLCLLNEDSFLEKFGQPEVVGV